MKREYRFCALRSDAMKREYRFCALRSDITKREYRFCALRSDIMKRVYRSCAPERGQSDLNPRFRRLFSLHGYEKELHKELY